MTGCLYPVLAALLPLTALASEATVDVLAAPTALAALIADRTAVERVYYGHRLGNKLPFEQALPAETIQQLVKLDLQKETALKQLYGVEPKPEWIEAEVRRINTQSRAPDVLAEIKAALGGNPARFARALARPIVVDRELRRRFETDDRWHAQARRQAEAARRIVQDVARRWATGSWTNIAQALEDTGVGTITEVTWQLGARPEKRPDSGAAAPVVPPTAIKARSSRYSIEATARLADDSDPEEPRGGADHERYFEDLSPELKEVLRAQPKNSGDVSAVIETPSDFLLFVVRERTSVMLTGAVLSVPKHTFEQWLNEQKD
jgi:hypothetical protein